MRYIITQLSLMLAAIGLAINQVAGVLVIADNSANELFELTSLAGMIGLVCLIIGLTMTYFLMNSIDVSSRFTHHLQKMGIFGLVILGPVAILFLMGLLFSLIPLPGVSPSEFLEFLMFLIVILLILYVLGSFYNTYQMKYTNAQEEGIKRGFIYVNIGIILFLINIYFFNLYLELILAIGLTILALFWPLSLIMVNYRMRKYQLNNQDTSKMERKLYPK